MSSTVRWAERAAFAAVVLALAGCGWTARDEFMRNRSVTVSSRPGDGSTVASDWKDGRGQTGQPEVAARFEEPER